MLVSTIYNDKKARTSTIHIFRVLFLFFVNIKRSQVINKWSFSSNDLLTRFRYISYGVWVHRCGFWVYCLKSSFSEQQLTPRKDEKKKQIRCFSIDNMIQIKNFLILESIILFALYEFAWLISIFAYIKINK